MKRKTGIHEADFCGAFRICESEEVNIEQTKPANYY